MSYQLDLVSASKTEGGPTRRACHLKAPEVLFRPNYVE